MSGNKGVSVTDKVNVNTSLSVERPRVLLHLLAGRLGLARLLGEERLESSSGEEIKDQL